MCRLPAGQTTCAISDSSLPHTCTCCEINYAFSSCQASKTSPAVRVGWWPKYLERCTRRRRWRESNCFLASKSQVWSCCLCKTMRHSLRIVDCSPLRKSGFMSTLLFHLPGVTLARLIPAAAVCSQEESRLLRSSWLNDPFHADDVAALQMSRRRLCRDVSSFRSSSLNSQALLLALPLVCVPSASLHRRRGFK